MDQNTEEFSTKQLLLFLEERDKKLYRSPWVDIALYILLVLALGAFMLLDVLLVLAVHVLTS